MELVARAIHLGSKLEKNGWPLLLLMMRLWLAHIFWHAGRIKLKHWDATLSLFKFEYKVPFIDPDLAAYLATSLELICPIMLAMGLLTRLATIPLIIMTMMIQITYLSHHDHIYWLFLLTTLLLKGGGPLSLDAWISKRL